MHKSWGNSIEFNEAADTMGADVMRWLYLSQKPEQNLLFGYNKGDEARRRFLIPLWNVYSFFITYASLDGWTPEPGDNNGEGQKNVLETRDLLEQATSPVEANAQLDRWIVARLDETTLAVTEQLEAFRAEHATQQLEALLDDLSNWYVRRSRRRFWQSEMDDDKKAAYNTLYHVLVTMTRLLAPFIPFVTEAMYQNLVRNIDAYAPRSVHHTFWPTADADALDHDLLAKMHLGVMVASLGRAARSAADIKLRQPLARARVNVASEQERQDILALADVLADELNVKEIEVASEVGELVEYKLLPNNRVLGPRFGADFPRLRQALLALDPAEAAAELRRSGQLRVELNGEPVTLGEEDVLVQTESRGGLAVASDQGVTVAVDVTLTPELEQEGYARDLVRAVNTMRKEAGLEISDRIDLYYEADDPVGAAMKRFADYMQQETLALTLEAGHPADMTGYQESTIGVGDRDVVLFWRKAT
jgi:isoleucyl-tRNA synthetase